MPNLHSRTRRVIVAGGFALALAAAPAAAVFGSEVLVPAPTATTACPAGEIEDLYTDECIPEMAPNVQGGAHPTPGVHRPTTSGVVGCEEHGTCVPYEGGRGEPGNIGNEGVDTVGDEEAARR